MGKELEESHQMQERFKQEAIKISREVVGLFGHSKDDTLLASDVDILTYAGVSFPTTPSPEAFYFFATYLTPKINWSTTKPWKEDLVGDLKVTLTRLCN